MDDNLQNFWDNVRKEETAILATAVAESVTMRTVSPVYYDSSILIFTAPSSQKYGQLKENPHCCVAVAGCYMQATPVFLGPTMLEENTPYREAYLQKFPGAFDESMLFGGRNAEFILFKPTKVEGWGFAGGEPTGPFVCEF